jgi:Flp pilus assembly protein protease CpaA
MSATPQLLIHALWGVRVSTCQAVLLVGVALASALFDLRSRRIPNWLTYGSIGLGLLVSFYSFGWLGIAGSLIGGLACGVIPLMLFAAGGLGGGDVKLFVALGTIAGALCGFEALALSMVLTVLIGFGKLAYRGELFRSLVYAVRGRRSQLDASGQELRFAVIVFLAVVATVWDVRFGFLRGLG